MQCRTDRGPWLPRCRSVTMKSTEKSPLKITPLADWQGTSPWDLLARVDPEAPILFLGSERSSEALLALSFDEETSDDFMLSTMQPTMPEAKAKVSSAAGAAQPGLKLSVGQIALLTYDAFNPFCQQASASSRFFRVYRSLVWQKATGSWFLCETEGAAEARYQLAQPLPSRAIAEEPPAQNVEWKSTWSDAQYIEAVAQSLEDIRDGRFYQINILRYWEHRGELGRALLIKRLRRFAGPFAAYIELPDLGLVSWSPERFVQIYRDGGDSWIEAQPIKGTRPVSADAEQNLKLIEELKASAKDKAELHMIVDLMRNDLHRICYPRSVEVVDPGSIQSFPNVHHLVASVKGRLDAGKRLDEICRAICPGGSITGAPKREVMDVIQKREERERGYFMGNILYRDAYSGHLDSSILIRTAVRHSKDTWEYAAGSGITVKSYAYEELQEVITKARIILENPW